MFCLYFGNWLLPIKINTMGDYNIFVVTHQLTHERNSQHWLSGKMLIAFHKCQLNLLTVAKCATFVGKGSRMLQMTQHAVLNFPRATSPMKISGTVFILPQAFYQHSCKNFSSFRAMVFPLWEGEGRRWIKRRGNTPLHPECQR